MNWKWIYEGDKRVIKQRTFLTDESIVNYFSLEKCPYVHRFWKPDQRAGHAQPVLIYSESRKQHVWFISETFQKVKYVSVWYHTLRASCKLLTCLFAKTYMLFRLPWWLSDKESTYQCRRHGFDLWSWRSPGEGNGNPLQYSSLGNPMDKGAWQATVHGVRTESDTT